MKAPLALILAGLLAGCATVPQQSWQERQARLEELKKESYRYPFDSPEGKAARSKYLDAMIADIGGYGAPYSPGVQNAQLSQINGSLQSINRQLQIANMPYAY